MSKAAKRYKGYYAAGWYTKDMLKNLAEKEKITEEEYEEITGESYSIVEENA